MNSGNLSFLPVDTIFAQFLLKIVHITYLQNFSLFKYSSKEEQQFIQEFINKDNYWEPNLTVCQI